MEDDAKPFLQEIRNAKKILKAKRFWQIQGLNIVEGLYYILARVWLNLAYTLLTAITIYGMPDPLNSRQIGYSLDSSFMIGLFIWFTLNMIDALKKRENNWFNEDFTINVWILLLKTALDVSVLLILQATLLNPATISSTDELLANLVLYTSLGEVGILFIRKISFAMIKKHFNDGEEKNKWKSWTCIKTVQNTKEYYALTPVESTIARSEWDETLTEKITVQLLYSRLTFSEVNKKESRKVLTSNHPERMFKKMTKEINRKDGYENRIN